MKKKIENSEDIKKSGEANQEIIDWKKRFELVAEASGQIVYDYNVNTGSIIWSGSIEKVLGYKLSEMTGGIKQWEKLIHKDDRKETLRLLKIAEVDLTPYEVEYRYKHKDGNYLIIKDQGFFIPDDKGKSKHLVGMMQDISSQKRSKQLITALNTAAVEMQKVFSKEELFKVVARAFKKMNIESMVSIVDDEKKNLYFKYFSYDSKLIKVAEKIGGMSAFELWIPINKHKEYEDVIYRKKTLLMNSSVEFIREILPKKVKFMAGQLTKMFSISRFIIAPLIVDDRVFGTFSVQAGDLLESDIPEVTVFAHQLAGAWYKGELIEKVQRDIKEREFAELALKDSEQKSRTIIEQLSEGFALIDETGRIIEWNNSMEKITGRNREDAVDMFFWDMQYEHLLPERRNSERYKQLNNMLVTALKNKNSEVFNKTFEMPILNMSGERKVIQSTIFPIFLGEKFFVGNVSRDITEQKKADEILRQSEERFSKAFKSSPFAITISDLETGHYIDVNENFIKFTGYAKDEILGRSALDLKLWGTSETRKKMTEELRKFGSIKSVQTEAKSKSGEIRICKASLEVIEINQRPCILTMIDDITEQKKIEIALQEREEIFRKIFEESSIGMVMSDGDANFINVNSAFCKMLGYTEQELIDKTFRDITHPDYENMSSETESVKKIKSGELIQYRAEKPYIHKRGKKIWGSLTLSSIRNEKGEFQYYIAMIEDINERKRAEILLKESNRKLNTLINNLTGVVYRCRNDEDWTMEFVSNGIKELTGYPPEDFIMNNVRTYDSVIEPEDRLMIKNIIQNALEEKESYTLNYRVHCANGDVKWVWEKGRGIFEGEKLLALEGYISDVTEQRYAERALKDSEETLKAFINALPEQAFLVDKNYKLILTNKALAKDYNLSPEKVAGKNMYDLLSKEDADRRANIIDKVLKTEEPVIFEDSRDNLFYINYIYPVFDAGNKVSKVAIFALDITSRLKAEKENLLLAQTLKSVKDAISITDLNNDVIFVNDAFLETYGYLESEVIGKNISFANPKGFHEVSDKIHRETIEGGYHDEIINIKKDGSEIPIELWTSTVKDATGSVVATVGVARDISERLKAEKESTLLAQTIKSVKDAITITDMNNNIIFVNDAFLETYGYDKDEVVGKHISFVVSEKNSNETILKVHKGTVGGNWNGELINRRKDGVEFPIELWTSVVKDTGNNNVAMVGVARDITERKQAEKEIEEANKKLIRAQRVARIGSWEDYLPTGELFWSDEMYNILGFDKGEKISLSKVSKIFAPEEAEKLSVAVTDAIKNRKPYSVDYKITTAKGELKYIHDEGEVKFDEGGNAIWMYGTTQDVTGNKLAEIALMESEERYRSIFDNAPIGMFHSTPDGKLININMGYAKMMGYDSIEELVEKANKTNIAEVIYAEPEKRKEFVKDVIKSGNWMTFENQYRRKDGKIVTCVVTLRSFANLVNKTIELEGFITDISKRKIAEENLRRSEEKFRSITEQTTDVVFITDNHGVITYLSPAASRIFGYEISEMMGKHFSEMLSKDNIDIAISAFRHTLENFIAVKNLQLKMIGKDGSIIYGELNANVFSVGNFLGTAGTIRDITERKRAEEELIKAKEKAEEMNRVKTSFLANMSHEVRTPLVAILGFSEVLSELIQEEELKNFVDMIHKGGERLLDTLNLILDLSVIEAQKIKIELAPLDIVEETMQVIELFEKAAKKKNLTITSEFEFDSFIINLDLKILRQITNNLVNNAIKYTKSGGINVKINKEEKENGSFIALRVEDTGIGIPDEMKSLIWEEFRQVSEGLNRSFEGTGLGLTITKKFVEKLGGEIFLEKSEVDIGSVFTVLFPIEDLRRVDSSRDLITETDKVKAKKQFPEILYIEDDQIAIDIVTTFIKDSYIVDSAMNGKEGIEKAKRKIYDAILMDINLGKDMDGLEATRIIRGLPGYENIPIVAITAFAMVGDKEEFFEKGCSNYISKPFTKKEFREMISDILPVKK